MRNAVNHVIVVESFDLRWCVFNTKTIYRSFLLLLCNQISCGAVEISEGAFLLDYCSNKKSDEWIG